MLKKLALFLFFASAVHAQVPTAPASSSTGNITASGSNCLTTNACISVHLPANSTSVAVTITGTWSATLVVEMAADNGVTWVSAGTAPSANGQTTYTLTAQTDFRVRASAFTSGTVGVFINSSQAPSGGGGGSGTVSSGTVNTLAKYTGTATVGNSLLDDGLTTANTLTYAGIGGINASGPVQTGTPVAGAPGLIMPETACSTLSASGYEALCSDSSHVVKLSSNGGGYATLGTLPIAHANIAATAVTPGSYTSANITVAADGSITAAANGSGSGVVLVPATTAANTIAPTANSVVGLTVLDTTGTPGDAFDVCTPSAGACGTKQFYVDSNGFVLTGSNFYGAAVISAGAAVQVGRTAPAYLGFTNLSDHITNTGSDANTDIQGIITVSSSTTGVRTFTTAYGSAPVCVVTPTGDPTTVGIYWATTSTTALTVTVKVSGTLSFNYMCMGHGQ